MASSAPVIENGSESKDMKTARKLLNGIVAGVLVMQVACATDPRNANQMTFEQALAFEQQSSVKLREARALVREMSHEEVSVRLVAELSDVTTIVKQTGHGIYVEYTAPDGRLYMWYPGNFVTVGGAWGIVESYSPPRACFKYYGAYHGVTGEFEPNECVPAAQTLSNAFVVDKRQGDVFGLSSEGVPYTKSAGNLPAWPEG